MGRWWIVLVALWGLVLPGLAWANPNAADSYRKALQAAHLDEVDQGDINAALGGGYRAKASLDKCLDDNQDAFRALRDGLAIDSCRFVPDVGVYDRDTGPYDDMRTLGLAFFANALRETSKGNLDLGLKDMLGTIRLGLQLQEDRILSARAAGQDLQMGAFLAFFKWLQREHPPADVLSRNQQAVSALWVLHQPFSKTIEAERLWGEASAADLAVSGANNRAFQGMNGSQIKAVVVSFKRQADEVYDALLKTAASKDFEALTRVEVGIARSHLHKTPVAATPTFVAERLVALLVPSFSHAWQDDQVGQVELRALPVLFRLKRYQADHHAWPKTVPSMPADPFGNGPFKYYVATHGCMLYSVGPDHHDDGGLKELADYVHIQGRDIVMRLP